MWTDFNNCFTFGFVDKLHAEYGKIKSSTAAEFCCRTTLWNLNVQLFQELLKSVLICQTYRKKLHLFMAHGVCSSQQNIGSEDII